MIKTKIKTKFQGLVWAHKKYINHLKEGKSVLIEHEGKIMTVTPEAYHTKPPKQGEETYTKRFNKEKNKRYHLYNFNFIPDKDQTVSQKKTKHSANELLAQCDDCGSIKIAMSGEQDKWQASIAVFENLPRETCYQCKVKRGEV